MADAPLLETRGITVRFGGHVAVKDVSMGITRGTVTGLIGPNGAGKTTLFNTITGLQRPTSAGCSSTASMSPRRRYKRAQMGGLARTFQRLELFVSLSVRDNLRVAGDIHNANGGHRIDIESETDRLLALTGLEDIADRDVSDIPPTGRARVVEVARALMTAPRILLLDEPASGQTEQETEQFAELLGELAAEGWRSAWSNTTSRW